MGLQWPRVERTALHRFPLSIVRSRSKFSNSHHHNQSLEQARRMVELSCRDEPLAVLVVVLPGEEGAAVNEAQRWQGLARFVREETRQTFVAVRAG